MGTEQHIPKAEPTEKLSDDRCLAVPRNQRAELAQFLQRQAAELTQRWIHAAAQNPALAPPVLDVAAAPPPVELSLSALIEHLEAAGPDTELPAHKAWLARWHEAGSERAHVRDHFYALRDFAVAALQETTEIPEAEKEALRGLLEAAIRNLRLETNEVELRRLLHEAEEARCQFESIFEHSIEAILIADPQDERVIAANPAAAALLRRPREELLQKTLNDILPNLSGIVREQLQAAQQDQRTPQILTVPTPQGNEAYEVSAAGLDYYGQPATQIFLRNVTERVHFSEALERRAEELQAELSHRLKEVERLQVFLQNVINALPTRLLVLNEQLIILHANEAYLRQRRLPREQVEGKHIAEVFPHSLLEEAGLRQAMENTLRTGDRVRWAGFRQATEDHSERILNIGLDPCPGVHGERNLLVTLEDVTERHRQLYERSILHQIVQAMLGMRDLPRLLHAILTGITAGGAIGLGFNRAILLLADEEEGLLKAEMAVGPESPEQAGQIWSELSQRRSLEEFLAAFDRLPPPEERPLRDLVARLRFPLDDTSVLPMLAAAKRETVHVYDAPNDPRVPKELYEALGVEEFVVAPLVVQDKIIGAAIADNSINHQRITQTDVQLLTALANHAALAIDSARMYAAEQRRADELAEAYRKLEAATERLVRSEALAAIGEVTAIVAHEIRNPLSTIGGFANMLKRRANDPEIVKRNAQIIVEEVAKLEEILGELLDFTKPARPQFASCSLHEIVEGSLKVVQPRADSRKVKLVVDIQDNLPPVCLDARQMQQVLTNLLFNAIDAMPEGGVATLRAWNEGSLVRIAISDTGQGIPASHLEQIFDMFFTTKPTGTGLGLALARKVIEDHGATISVASEEGKGTTFTITFDLDKTPPSPSEVIRLRKNERGSRNGKAHDLSH